MPLAAHGLFNTLNPSVFHPREWREARSIHTWDFLGALSCRVSTNTCSGLPASSEATNWKAGTGSQRHQGSRTHSWAGHSATTPFMNRASSEANNVCRWCCPNVVNNGKLNDQTPRVFNQGECAKTSRC
jgi:hypothetical protein